MSRREHSSPRRESLIASGPRNARIWLGAAAALAVAVAGCTPKPPSTTQPQVTVYFCKVGTDALVPTPFSVDRSLEGSRLENALVAQLLAGPAVQTSTVVLFPPDTSAAVDLQDDLATVTLNGPITKKYQGGASDEVGLFKSLTYTVTSVRGVQRVQVLLAGRKVPTLPGGEFEIDEPLTRETFAQ